MPSNTRTYIAVTKELFRLTERFQNSQHVGEIRIIKHWAMSRMLSNNACNDAAHSCRGNISPRFLNAWC
jgi:hypothetical protein